MHTQSVTNTLSTHAEQLLYERYLLRDSSGKVIETPTELFKRVASTVAQVEKLYNYHADVVGLEQHFLQLLTSLSFLPNSPALMNLGTQHQQLHASYVLPIDDTVTGIFETLKNACLVHKVGGGTGFDFSAIRPKHEFAKATHGVAAGPVAFLHLFSQALRTIKQNGRRPGANMAVLQVSHPDIEEFITSKTKHNLSNFNLSVAVTDDFMKAVHENNTYSLINPHTKKVEKTLSARSLFDCICQHAYYNGSPGLLFIDTINKSLPHSTPIKSTDPCGENPLLPYESIPLGSLNLRIFVKNKAFDYDSFKSAIHLSVRFLDNLIDINNYPLKETSAVTKQYRKLGLGIMGFADVLDSFGYAYASEQAVLLADNLMSFLQKEALLASQSLAKEKGTFPAFSSESNHHKTPVRNATIITIAPTGSISIIADCSPSIEPHLHEATSIPFEWHVRLQHVFQKYVDNAISKTVNLPSSATPEDVKQIFLLAHSMNCKGITVYTY